MPRTRALIAATALVLAAFPLAAQEQPAMIPELPVLYSARVVDAGGAVPGATSVYMRLQIEGISSDEQVHELAGVLAEKGQSALQKAVRKQPSVGWVTVGSKTREELRVVRWLPTGEGTVLRAVTDRPLRFTEVVNNLRSTEYPFAVVEIKFGPDGSVTDTTLLPAVKLKFNADGALEVTTFGTQPFRLMNVKQEPVKGKKK